jgi:hypothetical protein
VHTCYTPPDFTPYTRKSHRKGKRGCLNLSIDKSMFQADHLLEKYLLRMLFADVASLTWGGKIQNIFHFGVLPQMALYEQGAWIISFSKIPQSLLLLSAFKTCPLSTRHCQGSWAIPPRFHSTIKKGTQPTINEEIDTISNHRLPQYAAVTFRLTSHQTERALRVFIRQASSAEPSRGLTKELL